MEMTRLKNGKLRRKDGVWDPLKRSAVDKQQAEVVEKTPQSDSPSYRLAYVDMDFLCREELRPVRLQLELLKTEMALTERGIKSTVVMFGGARIPEPGGEAWAARNETQKRNLEQSSVYYDEARKFARLCTEYAAKSDHLEYVVVTGGGPGVMEAGNRGAADVGGPSIGLNIVLPHEQAPNPYVTPELSFNFHYFAIRKMHFLMRARAITIFPGGFPLYRKGEGYLDGKITLRFPEYHFSVFLEGQNLNKEYSKVYINKDMPVDLYYPGRRFFVGIQGKF